MSPSQRVPNTESGSQPVDASSWDGRKKYIGKYKNIKKSRFEVNRDGIITGQIVYCGKRFGSLTD